MLLNILHTIAITCAVGTNFYIKPQQNRLPNRDNRTPYTINTSWEQYQNIQELDSGWLGYSIYDANNSYLGLYTESRYYNTISIQNQYINGNGIRLTGDNIITYGVGQTRQTYSVIGVGNRTLDPVSVEINTDGNIESTWESARCMQRLYIFALTGNANNVETTLELNDILYNIGTYQEDFGLYDDNQLNGANIEVYTRVVQSTNQSMQGIVNRQDKNSYWKNSSLYEGQTQILTNIAGYNSTVSETFVQTTPYDNAGINAIQTTPINISIRQNKTNYFVIYMEARITTNYTPMPVLQQYTISEGVLYSTGTGIDEGSITIKGENIAVSGATEVVDVGGVMFEVLGMPFTFISAAFNLTLFPNTPYEINISLLFMSILAVLIFVFLIKILIKAFAGAGG